MLKWLYLAAGGVAGTFSRHFVSAGIYRILGPAFPWGTVVVNVTGCFAIGFIAALGEGRTPLGLNERLFLIAGFCGAYTTFSTFMLDSWVLVDRGGMALAVLNVVGSVLAGFLAFRLGMIAAQAF